MVHGDCFCENMFTILHIRAKLCYFYSFYTILYRFKGVFDLGHMVCFADGVSYP